MQKRLTEIEELEARLKKLREEEAREAEFAPTPAHKLALELHGLHATPDDYSWGYEKSWEEPMHARWLKRAVEALAIADGDPLKVLGILRAVRGI